MPPRTIHLVPHTHWDREWYEPFEVFRYRLVKVIDHVLGVLEEQPGFRHFTLDGQTVAIEDYLDIRPGAEPDVAAAIRDGRLSIGPFRVLADEFLCSSETLVRNLQQGAQTCDRLGGRLPIGYSPDPFGHASQLPQLLRLAQIKRACIWRGVPQAIQSTVFRWEAPDGSSVTTLYLPMGYGHAAGLPETAEELLARGERIAADLEPFSPGAVLVAPNGNDHGHIQDHLVGLIASIVGGPLVFRLGSLPEAFDAADDDGAPTWRGELRSGARANLLPGVLSARLPLKRLAARTAIELERFAEPLSALSAADPGRLLERAWRRVVENAGHDSITGCGVDEVAADVTARYTEASRIADLLAADGIADLAARVDTSFLDPQQEAVMVFNPSPRAHGGVVEVMATMPATGAGFATGDGAPAPMQPIEVSERIALDMDVRGEQLLRLVPMVGSRRLAELFVNGLQIEQARRTTIRLDMGLKPEGSFDVERAKAEVERLARSHPRARFHVLGLGPPSIRMLVAVPEVPGLGWETLRPVASTDGFAGARSKGGVLDNGILRVSVDAAGTLTIESKDAGRFDGLLTIRDDGDTGDEYTYAPPRRDLSVTVPDEVILDQGTGGPVEASLIVRRRYRIPAGLAPSGTSRSRRRIVLPVTTRLSVRAGERYVRATLELENHALDHRVMALFPLPFSVDASAADGPFSVDVRPLVGEGGPHEAGSAVFPSRRWVDVSDGERGLALLHIGSPAYEVVDRQTLGLTLLRSVGWLSRHGLPTRAGPAGPVLPTPGAQLVGAHRIDLALYPHAGDWRTGAVGEQADHYSAPLRALGVTAHAGSLPATGSALSLEPPCVQLSTLTRDRGRVLVRVWNECDDAVTARLRIGLPLGFDSASKVDLLGDEIEPLEHDGGMIRLPLRGWEIATVALT